MPSSGLGQERTGTLKKNDMYTMYLLAESQHLVGYFYQFRCCMVYNFIVRSRPAAAVTASLGRMRGALDT